MTKILVTGGAGFIGSHTCALLMGEGYTPVIVDNFCNAEEWIVERISAIAGKSPILYRGDSRDRQFLDSVFSQEKDISGVIHFAALKAVGESVREPELYYANNLVGLLTVLDAMKAHGVKNIVFSSSATVYGIPESSPIPEHAPLQDPESPYGATKVMAERILRDVVRSGRDIAAVSLRYFNPIGAHPSGLLGELPLGVPNNIVPYMTQVAAGKREKLTIFGGDYDTPDGTCVRDYIHVVDLADAHVGMLKHLSLQNRPYYDTFNVGTGQGTSVMELVTIFRRVLGRDFPYEIGPRRAGDIAAYYADNTKISSVVGWKGKYTVEDALRHAWKWQESLAETSSAVGSSSITP